MLDLVLRNTLFLSILSGISANIPDIPARADVGFGCSHSPHFTGFPMNTTTHNFRLLGIALAVLILTLVVAGCGGKKKTEPVQVGELVDYRDAAYGYRIKSPKGWIQDAEVGVRVKFFSAQDVDKRFLDPTGPYPDGVAITVEINKTASPDSMWKGQIAEMAKMGFRVDKEFPVKVSGKDAFRVNYAGNYTAQIKETGHHIYLSADTLLYDLKFAGFSDLYDAHKAVFDAVLASFELPKPIEKGRDQTLPSETMSEYTTQFFSFQYPDNFNFESVAKGNNDLALSLRGANKSCAIQFTVFGAKGLTLEKVFDQNRGRFAGAATGRATVGGQPSLTLTYSATKDVERRFYFLVKNDRVIRTTFDWLKPQRAEYLAAYERVVASVKLK
jgi:hypothetical protein